jgi:excisionase family DNA binding protein
MASETITVAEAAQRLGVSYSSIVRAISRGELPAIRIGHRTQIPTHVIDRLIADGNHQAAS